MTKLVQVASNQIGKEFTINQNTQALQFIALGAYNPLTSSGLTFGYFGGFYNKTSTGALFEASDGTLTLNASTINFVEFDPETGDFSVSTSLTTGLVHLYKVNTTATGIDTTAANGGITDIRTIAQFANLSAGGGGGTTYIEYNYGTPSNANTLTWVHNLGTKSITCEVVLRCINAEYFYVPGDETTFHIEAAAPVYYFPPQLKYEDNQITLKTANRILIMDYSSNNFEPITLANWELIFKAIY